MEIKTLYKMITGESAQIEHELNTLSPDGWRPITMSSQSSLLTVIVDNKIMEEAKHNLSSALAEDARRESPLEEAGFRELEILQRKLNPALTRQEQRCPKSRAATFN